MKINKMITGIMLIAGTAIFFPGTSIAQAPGITDFIRIGNQIWTKNNLDIANFSNGDSIPEAKSDSDWIKAAAEKNPAWCYYNNDPKNGKKFGRLYNWYAIIDPRGFVPAGWHVPSAKEWRMLEEYLGDPPGFKMKAKESWLKKGNGSDESGFSALAAGVRDYYIEYGTPNCYFSVKENWGVWWSSTPDLYGKENETFGLFYQFGNSRWLNREKGSGISVRLIKD